MNIAWSSTTPLASLSTAISSGNVTVKVYTSIFYMVTSAWRQWLWHTTICAIMAFCIKCTLCWEVLVALHELRLEMVGAHLSHMPGSPDSPNCNLANHRNPCSALLKNTWTPCISHAQCFSYIVQGHCLLNFPSFACSDEKPCKHLVCDLNGTLSHVPIVAF